MIAHAFIARAADWVLDYHLSAYAQFCDRIVCVLDRSPQSETICRKYGNVDVHHYQPSQDRPDCDPRGIICEEGTMRQIAWDLAARYEPDWIVLGDTDETPTPDIERWITGADRSVDVYYTHWVNCWQNARFALGGVNAKWSFQNPAANKKALLVRRRAGVAYRYNVDQLQHCRMEPNPINPGRAVIDETHVLVDSPKLIHLKYAAWARWQADPLRRAGGQYSTMEADAEIVSIPDGWHWAGLPLETLT